MEELILEKPPQLRRGKSKKAAYLILKHTSRFCKKITLVCI